LGKETIFTIKVRKSNGEQWKIDEVNAGSQEDYHPERDTCLREVDGVIITYDSSNRSSAEMVIVYIDMVLRSRDVDFFPIVIWELGSDITEREFDTAELEALFKMRGMRFPVICQSHDGDDSPEKAFAALKEEIKKERARVALEEEKKKKNKACNLQ
jgi:GTPase SAR1 family protein